MPINYKHYAPNWKDIRAATLERAGHKCIKIVLTVAHLDHNITNNDSANLRILCQLHHNRHDAAHRAANRRRRRTQTGRDIAA